jgi:hypothetical protein
VPETAAKREAKMHRIPLLVVAALAASLVAVTPATAEGVTVDQLRNAGWTCFVPPPFPDRIVCGNPALGLPQPPPDPNGRPAYSVFVFDREGNFRGTEHLTRADLFHGQQCPQSAWVFIAPIGYYECQHF